MNKWIIWAIRIILAAVFIYAGLVKIIDPAGFAKSIDNYRLLPWILTSIMAAVLPWVEVLCGVLLIWGRWLKGASLIIVILNAIFIIAIVSALARGLDIDCGCFTLSNGGSQVSIVRIVEDFIFLVMAGVLLFNSNKRLTQNKT